MNKLTYKILTIVLLIGLIANAQSQKNYKKTFEVSKKTILNFDTDNIDVTFKIWNKDEVKIDFSLDFINYSTKEIEEISNKVEIQAAFAGTFGNKDWLEIRSVSNKSLARLSYEIKDGSFYITNFSTNNGKEKTHKSVKELIASLQKKETGFQDFDGYVVFKNDSIPVADLEKTNHKGVKSIRSNYVIYLPAYLALNVQSNRASVTFEGELTSKIAGAFYDSTLKAESLTNPGNAIKFLNGTVKIGAISQGMYSFRNVTNGMIGKISDANITTEFSKFQIGEITKNSTFKDFKSDITIYNLNENFETIKMHGEYSDIKLFIDKNHKYYMEAIGHNAIMKDGDMKIGMQPNREGKKHKMFTRGTKETASNTFMLDLVHGFITLNYIN